MSVRAATTPARTHSRSQLAAIGRTVSAMTEVVQIFRDRAFDPEGIERLSLAYELASKSVRDRRPAADTETIARRIIGLAAQGECDPRNLADRALKDLGFTGLT